MGQGGISFYNLEFIIVISNMMQVFFNGFILFWNGW